MDSHIVVNMALTHLVRDPALPPRIWDEGRLETLRRSMRESGIAQPVLVRPAPMADVGRTHYIVLGAGRHMCAGQLGWQCVPVIVNAGLDDRTVLELALDEDQSIEKRSRLERAWYYAALCAKGMTQAELAARENVSTGTAHNYVTVGEAITPQRIEEAGLDPKYVAGWDLVKLLTIAKEPADRIAASLAAAAQPTSTQRDRTPCFTWKEGKAGAHATFRRMTDTASWSQAERLELISRIGPALSAARYLEGVEDPALTTLRARMAAAHAAERLSLEQRHHAEVLRLMERLFASERRAHGPTESRPANSYPAIVRALRRRVQQVLRWVGRPSIIENDCSIIESTPENDPQIRLRFDGEQAA